jgi:H+/Cl- antiporter ClcA
MKLMKGGKLALVQTFFMGYMLRWLLFAGAVGALVGSASAFFLVALEFATDFREENTAIIFLLPLAGLVIGLIYYHWGKDVESGNNRILDEFYQPRRIIPLKMAPLVLFGTVMTHLFGGSAGREGTAVQMGGAIADQFTWLFNLRPRDRRVLLVIGVSAGFASVFGTPLAGAVFALEVLVMGRVRYDSILPSFLAAVVADMTCTAWGVGHTHYNIGEVAAMTPFNLVWAMVAGIIFGLIAMVFSTSTHWWGERFGAMVAYAPLRPVIGGAVIAMAFLAMGSTRYLGLGIPVIQQAFETYVEPYDFVLKILFTSFTLGAGFKGGEVTPLFFIGATLGNALAWLLPLPMPLLAGMGFVAVFAGATNTPIACTIMGIELFGVQGGVFIAIACVTAYLFSGHTGIYSSQMIGSPKHLIYGRLKSSRLRDVGGRKD